MDEKFTSEFDKEYWNDYLQSLSPDSLLHNFHLISKMLDSPCFVESSAVDYLNELSDLVALNIICRFRSLFER